MGVLIFAGGFAIYGAIVAGYYLSTHLISALVIPRKHAGLRDMRSTEAYRSLRSDGYGITPDWRTNAVEQLKKQRK